MDDGDNNSEQPDNANESPDECGGERGEPSHPSAPEDSAVPQGEEETPVECPCGCGYEFGDRVLSIGPNHFAICETHRYQWFVGSDRFSRREQTPEQCDQNQAELAQYKDQPPVASKYGCGCFKEFGDLVYNVGRNHYAVCETHRYFWWAGSNLFSHWRYQTPEDWEYNKAELAKYMEPPSKEEIEAIRAARDKKRRRDKEGPPSTS